MKTLTSYFIFYFRQQQRIRMLAENWKYGIWCLRFCGECRGTEFTNNKVCIRTLKRAKPSEIEKRKITTFLEHVFIS